MLKNFKIDIAFIKLAAGLVVFLFFNEMTNAQQQELVSAITVVIAALLSSDLAGLAIQNKTAKNNSEDKK